MISQSSFPAEAWRQVPPAVTGLEEQALQHALNWLDAQLSELGDDNGLDEALLIRNGCVVWAGNAVENVHEIWSCTKSFTSTVLGCLLDEGRCSLEDPVWRWMPELRETYGKVTLRHLANMTSGYDAVGCSYDLDGSADPFVPSHPLFSPGSHYQYWDDAMNLFGLILTRVGKESMAEVFRRRIAEPIGMKNWTWGAWDAVDGLAVNGGSGNWGKGIRTNAVTFARLGLLFLHHGEWNGTRCLAAEWVREATRVQVPCTIPNVVYALRTHLCGAGAYGFKRKRTGMKKYS